MSSRRQKLLDNIGWFVSDSELEEDLSIDGRALEKDEFLETLSNIHITWTRRSSNDDTIIFLYPITNSEKTDNTQIGSVETVKYDSNLLRTALEVIGAINSHYYEPINLNNPTSISRISHRGMELLLDGHKSDLLDGNTFGGVELIIPGVYYVNIEP